MQAIRTTYLAPTNTKGARIKATCAAKSKMYDWEYELDVQPNHEAAANHLANVIMGWNVSLVTGQLKDGSYVHVITGKKEIKVL